MTASARLAELGLHLPAVAAPVGSYQPAVLVGDLVFTSGQLPLSAGRLPLLGRLGVELTTEQGASMARVAALNALAATAEVAGGVDNIRRVVKLVVFVASDPSFSDQAGVANGASDLLTEVLGESGRHARSAVGVASLPLQAPVEVELVCELRTVPA